MMDLLDILPGYTRWNNGNPLFSVAMRAICMSFFILPSFPFLDMESRESPVKYVSVTSIIIDFLSLSIWWKRDASFSYMAEKSISFISCRDS